MSWRTTILLLFLSGSCFSQSFQKITYSVEEGLITHLTKTLASDSIGYLWIGTDEGLVRYDGRTFKNYENKTQSRFIKRLRNINNELWAISDLGIVKIHSTADSVIFENVLNGIREDSDSLLHYPKDVFQDSNGRLWVSEPDNVVEILDDGSIKKHHFPDKAVSNSFLTSFQFFESGRDLYAISYTGYFFKHTPDGFQEMNLNSTEPLDHTYSVLANDSLIWVGSSNGVYEIQIDSLNIDARLLREFEVTEVATLSFYDGENLLVGNYNGKLQLINLKSKAVVNEENVHQANYMQVTSSGDIWIASDEGLVLFKRNYFNRLTDDDYYVESILPLEDELYYCFSEILNKVKKTKDGYIQKTLLEGQNYYFLSVAGKGDHIWVGDKRDIIHLYKDQVVETIQLGERGNYVFDLLVDDKGRLWVNQDETAGPLVIDTDGTRTDYAGVAMNSRIMSMRKDEYGDIYFGSVGTESYLYKFDQNTKTFQNLSIELPIEITSDFEINDLLPKNDTVWLATTLGLLYYTNNDIQRIDLGSKLTELSTKAVTKENETLWISNTFGVISYNLLSKQYVIFNESSGLPSRSGNGKALRIDQYGTKWIGSAQGIVYADKNSLEKLPTKQPIFSEIAYNGRKFNSRDFKNVVVGHGSYVKLSFVSLSIPGKSLEYQYRQTGEDWKSLGNANFIEIPDAEDGLFTYEVRAKQQGNYAWSTPASITFRVDIPFYFQFWFIGILLVIIALVAYAIYRYSQARLAGLEAKLNKVVNEKTLELQEANNELKQANKELDMFVYSASHDMKAPLSSLIGLLNIYELEPSEEKKKALIGMMRGSIMKLDAFLLEVIDYSKNSRLGVEKDQIDFGAMIKESLDSLKYIDEFERITIEIDDQVETMVCDKNRLKIVLNNLISNSIRYMDGNKKEPWIKIALTEEEEKVCLCVEDNGIGIESEYLGNIFDMFYRANESKAGSGLGLYIVKEAVKILGGEITVESVKGEGTCFLVKLPK